ncbi:MAG: hypothetical protein RL095_1920 [Verrucomicrobiota bacterium]|jgi:hypothetical protein
MDLIDAMGVNAVHGVNEVLPRLVPIGSFLQSLFIGIMLSHQETNGAFQ